MTESRQTESRAAEHHIHLQADDVRRVYKRYAPIYDVFFGKIVDTGRKQACEHVNSLGGRVLEAGVGTGLSLPMFGPDVKVTGVDLSGEMLERARQRVAREGLTNVEELREMDIAALDYPDDSFDVVVSMYTITAVPDPLKVMAEFERVCRPGGEVVLVSHFKSEKGLYQHVEALMAPHGKKLGWHPAMPVEYIMGQPNLTLVETRRFRPFGLFSMLRFRKTDSEAPEPLH
ncbi:class I SAM-dependent methyltransferase [Lutibaculum baratangense]|uniref:Phosphatidylethanolamine N-methyltransferase n=1 Tax=Lutibaculum baratangense AMV1 TaxID=631454 RepID=V4QSE0_9HYPH|nr:class I SAM-dependent methyltransferase [Lutibaculum baratangense]ESR22697.1 Phosphatidylethanolamine N-methyltransferase [Lutibaculum baratangense AMV1]